MGKSGAGGEMKNEAVRNKMKNKEKEEKEKGESDFLLIYGTLLLILYINVTFHDPLRGKLAAGEKCKN